MYFAWYRILPHKMKNIPPQNDCCFVAAEFGFQFHPFFFLSVYPSIFLRAADALQIQLQSTTLPHMSTSASCFLHFLIPVVLWRPNLGSNFILSSFCLSILLSFSALLTRCRSNSNRLLCHTCPPVLHAFFIFWSLVSYLLLPMYTPEICPYLIK